MDSRVKTKQISYWLSSNPNMMELNEIFMYYFRILVSFLFGFDEDNGHVIWVKNNYKSFIIFNKHRVHQTKDKNVFTF
jgi:hypothetical protein